MKDIFTLKEISQEKPEHVIPAGLGGRLQSKALIDASTNELFGSTIERTFLEALVPIRAGLGLLSRRGGELSFKTDEPDILVGGNWTPSLSPRAGGIEQAGNEVTITAANPQQAQTLLRAVEVKFGHRYDVQNAKVTVKRTYPDVSFTLALGGPVHHRAIAQICYEYAALQLSRDVICSDSFADVREWIMQGVRDFGHTSSAACAEPAHYVNWETRMTWEDYPALDASPFQHRIIFASGPDMGGALALVELFGAFRFGCRLSLDPSLPSVCRMHIIDPLDGAKRMDLGHSECSPLSLSLPVAASVPSAPDGHGQGEQLRKLLDNLQAMHRESSNKELVQAAIAETFPLEGEVLEDHHIAAFTSLVAERFVNDVFRKDSDETMTLEAWKRSRGEE